MCLWTPGEAPKIRTKSKGNKLADCNADVLEVSEPEGQLHADILSSITNIGRERGLFNIGGNLSCLTRQQYSCILLQHFFPVEAVPTYLLKCPRIL